MNHSMQNFLEELWDLRRSICKVHHDARILSKDKEQNITDLIKTARSYYTRAEGYYHVGGSQSIVLGRSI